MKINYIAKLDKIRTKKGNIKIVLGHYACSLY